MKLFTATLLVLSMVSVASATWFGLWGYTWAEKPGMNILDVLVQAESEQGNSAIVENYLWNGKTRYDMDGGGEIPTGRYYYRVHAWKPGWEGENKDGFYFNGGEVQRDVTLHAISK